MTYSVSVVYLGAYFSAGATAADRRVRDITRGLAAEGATVRLVLPSWHRCQASLPPSDAQEYEIIYCGPSWIKSQLRRLLFWPAAIRCLKMTDAVYLYGPTIDCLLPVAILRMLDVSVLADFSDLMRMSKVRPGLRQISWTLTDRILPAIASVNIAISSKIEHELLKVCGPGKIARLPIAVDLEQFAETARPKRTGVPRIGYAGGLWHDYGVEDLLSATKLLSEHVEIELHIAGSYTDPKRQTDVCSLAEELDIEDLITYHGWLDTANLVRVIDSCDVVCIPHRKTAFTEAGFPTKAAEYASMSRPIVATDVGDLSEYFEEEISIVLCKPNQPEDMARMLLKVIAADDAFRASLGKEARIVAQQHFDYRSIGARILEVLS